MSRKNVAKGSQRARSLVSGTSALDGPCNADSECVPPAVCAYRRCQCPRNFIRKLSHCIPGKLSRNGPAYNPDFRKMYGMTKPVLAPSFNQGCPDGHCMEPFVCNKTIKVCDCPEFMNKTYYGCSLSRSSFFLPMMICNEQQHLESDKPSKIVLFGE